MPHLLTGENPPGPKAKRREDTPSSTAYGTSSCDGEESSFSNESATLSARGYEAIAPLVVGLRYAV
jgi:hypothetical protein